MTMRPRDALIRSISAALFAHHAHAQGPLFPTPDINTPQDATSHIEIANIVADGDDDMLLAQSTHEDRFAVFRNVGNAELDSMLEMLNPNDINAADLDADADADILDFVCFQQRCP